uniref:Uncharacterized protein n=1 Tax=viral metagenome TaxID=1070528 RepID=A0A6C0H8Q7_9ZZZZ
MYNNNCVYSATGDYICRKKTTDELDKQNKCIELNIYNISNDQTKTHKKNIDNYVIISSINPIISSNNKNTGNNTCSCKTNI